MAVHFAVVAHGEAYLLAGPAAAYAKRMHAGTVADHRDRYADLASRGVSTVFVSLPDLDGPDDVAALAGLNA